MMTFNTSNKTFSASPTTGTVLVVDDEEMVTKTLAAFLELETDYHVLTFQSPIAALDVLKGRRVDVIISDFLMPEMDGLQFLSEVKRLYPDISLILLTGYADKENAIKGINEVGLFQYIEKPWDNDHLKMVIRNAFTQKNLQQLLREKIGKLDRVLLDRDRLSEQNEILRDEMLLARNVQESLLPENLPCSSGISIRAKYLPALQVGGDFYDIITLADGQLGILIADVTGHGIQAALITVLVKSSFSTFAGSSSTPREILTYMNKVLEDILPSTLFVAALVVTIDGQSGKGCLANGGIPHPIIMRKVDRYLNVIPAKGLLLGVADESLFDPGEEVTFQLRAGESLILYTDGVSEVENEKEEQFEHEMREALLAQNSGSESDLPDYLVAQARKFARPGFDWDDMTVLTVDFN